MLDLDAALPEREDPIPGMVVLRRHASDEITSVALAVIEAAPPRVMTTPMGKPMSVAITNCGSLGWITDRHGYRYVPDDPSTGTAWPAMPGPFRALAATAAATAGFADFVPDACLINVYRDGTRMGLHQDRDEVDFSQPIVSVSLGRSALFRFGGVMRGGPTRSVRLNHRDVVVFGGLARRIHHGIDRLLPGDHPVLGANRINLTFRKAG